MQRIVAMSTAVVGACGLALVPNLSAFAASTHASLVTSKVVFQQAPITNPATLFYDAKHGISAIAHSPFHLRAEMINQQGEIATKPFGVKVFSTTQFIKKVQFSNGKIEKDYVTTGFAVANTASDPSYNNTNWDSTGAVEAWGTSYSNNVTVHGDSEMQLTKITGGWNNNDNLITLQNPKVTMSADGWSRNGGYVTNQNMVFYPSLAEYPFQYMYYAPSSWYSISASSTSGRTFGQETDIALVRGTSTWSLYLNDFFEG